MYRGLSGSVGAIALYFHRIAFGASTETNNLFIAMGHEELAAIDV